MLHLEICFPRRLGTRWRTTSDTSHPCMFAIAQTHAGRDTAKVWIAAYHSASVCGLVIHALLAGLPSLNKLLQTVCSSSDAHSLRTKVTAACRLKSADVTRRSELRLASDRAGGGGGRTPVDSAPGKRFRDSRVEARWNSKDPWDFLTKWQRKEETAGHSFVSSAQNAFN